MPQVGGYCPEQNKSHCPTTTKITPTRSCQVCSKQFCLWDLALIIYVVSIIHMVWAI